MRQTDVDRAIDIVSEFFDKFGDEEPFDAKAFIASRV
jgi:hypothetical protein